MNANSKSGIALSKEDKAVNIFVMICMVFVFLLTAYPFYYVIVMSFNEGTDALAGGIYFWPRVWSLDNYSQFMTDEKWLIGIGVSVNVNIVILTIGAVGSNVILGLLPEAVTSALNFLLPALFGAVFGQFAVSRPKLAVVSILIVFAINWLNNNGFLGGFAGSVVILVSVFGSIFAGRFIYKKELADDGNEVK